MSFGVVTFLAADGQRVGVLAGDHVRDATEALAPLLGERFGVLQVLEHWEQLLPALRRVAEVEGGTWQVPLARTHLLAPLPRPVNLYCAFANYIDHMKEMGGTPADKMVEDPFLFMVPVTAVVAPDTEIVVPLGPDGHLVQQLDWEGELAAVIGKAGRNLSPEQALDYVAGYTIVHDVSIRGGARRGANGGRPDFLASKGRATFKPLGPAIVPAEFVGDPQVLRLQTRINGVTKQDSNTAQMIFSTAEQIAFASRLTGIVPGDVFATGTPAGVGLPRGEFLKPGDTVEIEIERVGLLRNRLIAE